MEEEKLISKINRDILSLKEKGISTKNISDGYHTFEELYYQRTVLLSIICNTNPNISWKSKKHFDEENDPMFEDCFIIGINTPTGEATYHIKLKYWEIFDVPEIEHAPKYAGYSSDEVLKRLQTLR